MNSGISKWTVDPVTVIMAISLFGLVLAVWLFFTLLWGRRRAIGEMKIRERLDPESNQSPEARTLRLWHDGGEKTTIVIDESIPTGPWRRFQDRCKRAGWRTPASGVASGLALTAVIVSGLVFVVTGRGAPAIMGAVGVFVTFLWYVNLCVIRMEKIYERQLVDGLELSARALRAGHPLLSSFQLIAEEIPAPVGKIFTEICQEYEMGTDLESGLRRAARESESADMRLFSASLAINLRTGGNLADVVDGLALVIRERMKLSRRFRILIAQTQLSKRILLAMPILMFVMLSVLKPDYMDPLFSTQDGSMMLLFAGFSLGLGWWMMNKMAALHS